MYYSQEQEMKEEKGTGAEAESQSQLVAKEDNKGMIQQCFFHGSLVCKERVVMDSVSLCKLRH